MGKKPIVIAEESVKPAQSVRDKTQPKLSKTQWVELIARKLIDKFNVFHQQASDEYRELEDKKGEYDTKIQQRFNKVKLPAGCELKNDHGVDVGTGYDYREDRRYMEVSIKFWSKEVDKLEVESKTLEDIIEDNEMLCWINRLSSSCVHHYDLTRGTVHPPMLIRAAKRRAGELYDEENGKAKVKSLNALYNDEKMQMFLDTLVSKDQPKQLAGEVVDVT